MLKMRQRRRKMDFGHQGTYCACVTLPSFREDSPLSKDVRYGTILRTDSCVRGSLAKYNTIHSMQRLLRNYKN